MIHRICSGVGAHLLPLLAGRGRDDGKRRGAVLAEQEADLSAVLVLDGAGVLDGADGTADAPHRARLGLAEEPAELLHLCFGSLPLGDFSLQLDGDRHRLLPDSLGRRGFGFATRHQPATAEPQQRRNQRHCDERGRIPPKGRQSHE